MLGWMRMEHWMGITGIANKLSWVAEIQIQTVLLLKWKEKCTRMFE
jgi:hypothetical protein